jgi:hypothetical protein
MSSKVVKEPPRDDTDIRASLLSYYASQTTSQATILLTIVLVAIGVLQLDVNRLPTVVSNIVLSVLVAAAVRSLLKILYWGALATGIQNVRPANLDGSLMSRYQYGALDEIKGKTWKEEGRKVNPAGRLEAWLFARSWTNMAICIVVFLIMWALLQNAVAVGNVLSRILSWLRF